jgi:hypothetical protein
LCNAIKTIHSTDEVGSAYLSGAPESTTVHFEVRVAQSLVFRCSMMSFCFFGHFVLFAFKASAYPFGDLLLATDQWFFPDITLSSTNNNYRHYNEIWMKVALNTITLQSFGVFI